MAKIKLTLGPLPDFKLPVSFVMPDGNEQQIIFTVKHKPASEVHEMYKKEGIKDADFIMLLATDWDVEDEFNKENAARLVDYYPGAALALMSAYLGALAGQRVKN